MHNHPGQTIITLSNGEKHYTDDNPRDILSQLEDRL